MFSLDDKFFRRYRSYRFARRSEKAFCSTSTKSLSFVLVLNCLEGLSDQQLEEFEKIIDKDQTVIGAWISNVRRLSE